MALAGTAPKYFRNNNLVIQPSWPVDPASVRAPNDNFCKPERSCIGIGWKRRDDNLIRLATLFDWFPDAAAPQKNELPFEFEVEY